MQPGDRGRLVFDVADLEALCAATAGNLALVAVNFPHNPTGAVLSEEELAAVVAAVCGRGAWLFSDEMYRGLGAVFEYAWSCSALLRAQWQHLRGPSDSREWAAGLHTTAQ